MNTRDILDGIQDIGEKVAGYKKDVAELRETIDNIEATQAKTIHGGPKSLTFEKQIADQITEKSDAFAKLQRGEKGAKVELEFSSKAVGTVTTANVTGGTVWGAQYKPGIVELPTANNHARDIISVLQAGPGTDYYFMRETAGEGAPAPAAENTTKSQFDTKIAESNVKFETIAGWELFSRKALNNIPGFISFVQKSALNKILDAEDAQILYGDGTSPNLKGILTSGNYVASTATGPLVERILADIAVLEDTHKRQANAIALRPVDYWSFFKNKASGSGEYDLPLGISIVGTQLYLWGVPVIKLPALKTNAAQGEDPATNDYIVGDFQNGIDILQQEAVRIEFFEQDADNVRKNLITMRIECVEALPIYGGNFFVGGKI